MSIRIGIGLDNFESIIGAIASFIWGTATAKNWGESTSQTWG
jgi:hypothetical protein